MTATNEVLEAMGTARAMRYFLPDPVPPELLDQLLWAATRASSPNNTQPWDFVVVTDADVRRRIGDLFRAIAPTDTTKIASLPDESEQRTREGAFNLMHHFDEMPAIVFVCGTNAYPARSPEPSFMYSAMFAAAQNLVVAARSLGLGSAFTTFHRSVEADLRSLLGIPDDRTIGVTIPIGWPARPFGPVRRRPIADVVHRDHW